MPSPAYLAALKMLAARELSERQLRERLARRGYDAAAIDDAVSRLKAERSLDDERVARALARQEVLTKRHGRVRAERQLAIAGIDSPVARAALDDVFGGLDEDALIAGALRKRLRDDESIQDDRTLQRLYRYLVRQGFTGEHVLRTLSDRRST